MTATESARAGSGPVIRIPIAARRQSGRSRSRILLAAFAVLSLTGVAGLTALGIWQFERRVWKLELIDRVEQRIHAVPVSLPDRRNWSAISAADDAYRRVRVTGRFLHDRQTLVQAVTKEGGGYWVLTPLMTNTGVTVLINRGFVPRERPDLALRQEAEAPRDVEITGLLRMTEPDGAFLRSNNPVADRWYSRDVSAIAAVRGLGEVAPFFIDADASSERGPWPRGGLTVVAFPNNHLVYGLTWFALAGMLAGATLFILWEERRRSFLGKSSVRERMT